VAARALRRAGRRAGRGADSRDSPARRRKLEPQVDRVHPKRLQRAAVTRNFALFVFAASGPGSPRRSFASR
jgi:hypothetical protein